MDISLGVLETVRAGLCGDCRSVRQGQSCEMEDTCDEFQTTCQTMQDEVIDILADDYREGEAVEEMRS